MSNNKLHYYLPHDIQTDKGKLIGIKRGYSIIEDNKFLNGIEYMDIDLKYYLYPLSCLTETIVHNGKEEIPLVELAKISGRLNGFEKIEIIHHQAIKWINSTLTVELFEYHESGSFCSHEIGSSCLNVFNQLLLFEKCFEYRINMFPDEIDAIDPRTLEVNPYLITSKK